MDGPNVRMVLLFLLFFAVGSFFFVSFFFRLNRLLPSTAHYDRGGAMYSLSLVGRSSCVWR